MKRFLTAMLALVLLLSASGCGKGNTDTESAQTTTENNAEYDANSSDSEFDSMDNANNLKMKMYGDYYCVKTASTFCFFDGKVAVSYTHLTDETTDETPKDISAFSARFPRIFKSRIFAKEEGFKLSFKGEKELNGFKVKEFEGTVTDDQNTVHNTKAYTFVCGGRDCVVIAAPIENTDDMIEKMNKDIDIFMNNLEIDK